MNSSEDRTALKNQTQLTRIERLIVSREYVIALQERINMQRKALAAQNRQIHNLLCVLEDAEACMEGKTRRKKKLSLGEANLLESIMAYRIIHPGRDNAAKK